MTLEEELQGGATIYQDPDVPLHSPSATLAPTYLTEPRGLAQNTMASVAIHNMKNSQIPGVYRRSTLLFWHVGEPTFMSPHTPKMSG